MGQVAWKLAATMAVLLSNAVPTATRAQNEAVPPPVLLFFDWGKPEIGSDAVGLLDGVVASYRATPALRLNVTGHSDRSGSAAGNHRSAARRAAAVSAYLAERGVPRSAMAIASLGEERPLIPTADGVREPQNRRVEVSFTR